MIVSVSLLQTSVIQSCATCTLISILVLKKMYVCFDPIYLAQVCSQGVCGAQRGYSLLKTVDKHGRTLLLHGWVTVSCETFHTEAIFQGVKILCRLYPRKVLWMRL